MPDDPAKREAIDHAAEVLLDFIVGEAHGLDDDVIVSLEPRINLLADVMGLERVDDIPLRTAGEVRAMHRRAKADLARGRGPGRGR